MNTLSIVLKNITIWNPNEEPKRVDLYIKNGKIVHRFLANDRTWSINGESFIAMPGFVDLHIHGAMGGDVMDATQEALQTISEALVKEGTTAFLATTMTQSPENIEKALLNATTFTSSYSQMIGIHLEGPFVNKLRAGAQPAQYIQNPNIEIFLKWVKVSKNLIKYVTIAPELVYDHFIEEANRLEIIVSAGHTDATSIQLKQAQQKGLQSVTHLYNQMKPFHHREIGAIGEALLNDELYCELIADFVHSSNEAVRFAFKNKGADRLLLITDAMRAKGLSAGKYDLGGQQVTVDEDARLEDGTLAGSILKMNIAVKNMALLGICSPQDLVKMSSYNANRLLKREGYGEIQIGNHADIVILDEQLNVLYTIVSGEVVYQA
ncbi:N-acetylglucosamine-6-phosphate deacetylase [Solibacillus sp. FSL K6-1781]|uniref:N-acetylglucosamine-6-phosphate deacetylase n=1 Tax=Solibacillus sp. FSL K6-1781 TaxID=2921474 RepID=UPI00315AA566